MKTTYSGYDRQSAELMKLINSVIGIPYCQKPQYRNDSTDITRLSKKEWFAAASYARIPRNRVIISEAPGITHYRETEDMSEIDLVEDPKNLVKSMPSINEAEHAQSLELSPIFYYARLINPIYRQLCGYFLTCSSLNIAVKDYVLQNPKLLADIVKIAERPCDYIRTIDEIKPGDEIVYYSNYESRGKVFRPLKLDQESLKLSIKRARERLDCDNKNGYTLPSTYHPSINIRKLVLLMINNNGVVNIDTKDRLNIIIERKDIK